MIKKQMFVMSALLQHHDANKIRTTTTVGWSIGDSRDKAYADFVDGSMKKNPGYGLLHVNMMEVPADRLMELVETENDDESSSRTSVEAI